MDANVWKTTSIGVNRSVPGAVHLRYGLSSKLKYFRTAINLRHEFFSENIGMS